MITPEQIKELPRKYAIGKRPLSRILGWGELTYTRLLEGSLPTPQHEEELLRALNEPLTYIMLLDQAHDAGTVSDTSYARSRKAADEYLRNDSSAEDVMKLHAVARRFCVLAEGEITPKALQILVYIANRDAESPLFDQQYDVQEEVPVYNSLATWFTFERIQETGKAASSLGSGLESEEEECLAKVFNEYGIYSTTKLEDLVGEVPEPGQVKKESETVQEVSEAEVAPEEPTIAEQLKADAEKLEEMLKEERPEKPSKKDKKKKSKAPKKEKKSSKKKKK